MKSTATGHGMQKKLNFEYILVLSRTYGAFLIFLFLSFSVLNAQKDTLYSAHDIDFSTRKKVFLTTAVTGYVTTATGLYFAWYKDYEQSTFHSFNDWGEWLQMDKVGHAYSAYTQCLTMYETARWSGYSENKALNIASISSVVGQLTIEVLDGFTEKWGFSYGDLAFNMGGTGLYYLQQKHLNDQPFQLKLSYWPETYPFELTIRANELYGTGTQKFLKDYNGQAYWLSVDMNYIFPDSNWPRWLDLAFGFSAQNLYGGFENSWTENGEVRTLDDTIFTRTRQFVVGLDYDLTEIKTNSPFLKGLLGTINMLKLPAPAIEYNTQDGFVFHLVFTN